MASLATTASLYGGSRNATGISGGTPDQVAASITRSQWQNFLDTYRPVEEQLLSSALQTDFTAEGDEAGNTARSGVQAASGTLARNLSRSGASLTADESAAVDRRKNLSLAKAAAGAENSTRRVLSDSRTDLLQDVVSIGRGVATTASSSAQSVADLAAQRESTYQQQRAAATNSNLSAAASAAALLIAL